MAKIEETEVAASSALKNIEALQKDSGVTESVHEAVKAANGWRKGKELTIADYKKAVENFLKAPIKGGK